MGLHEVQRDGRASMTSQTFNTEPYLRLGKAAERIGTLAEQAQTARLGLRGRGYMKGTNKAYWKDSLADAQEAWSGAVAEFYKACNLAGLDTAPELPEAP